jgi:hypothetical protein
MAEPVLYMGHPKFVGQQQSGEDIGALCEVRVLGSPYSLALEFSAHPNDGSTSP